MISGIASDLPSPRVPPELVDYILDHLHASKADLAQCSLVSRVFLPSSRYHLFSEVTVTGHNYAGLCGLLACPHNTMVQSVRGLRLLELMQTEGMKERWLDGAAPVLAVLQGVETLHIEGVVWWLLSPAAQAALCAFQNVRALHLESSAFLTGTELARVTGAYPRLRSVRMQAVVAHTPGETPTRDAPRGYGLRSLDLQSCRVDPWLEQGVETGQLGEIRDVRVMCDNAAQLYPLIRFVKAAGRSFETLHVVLSECVPAGAYQALDLSGCVNLCSLHIDMSSLAQRMHLLYPMSWVPAVLCRLPPTSSTSSPPCPTVPSPFCAPLAPPSPSPLRELSFTVSLGLDADPGDWAEIGACVAHAPALAGLTRVQLWVRGDGLRYVGDVEDEMRALMFPCAKKRILKIN